MYEGFRPLAAFLTILRGQVEDCVQRATLRGPSLAVIASLGARVRERGPRRTSILCALRGRRCFVFVGASALLGARF